METITFKISKNHGTPIIYQTNVPNSFFNLNFHEQNVYLLKSIGINAL